MSEPAIPIARFGNGIGPAAGKVGSEDSENTERRFLEYYGLSEQPFGVTPDPRFLYLGSKHLQALTALTYGTEMNRGFMTLIAKPGMGKTSLLFQYLSNLRDKARTAFLFQTVADPRDLMRYLLADLGLDGNGKDLPEMHAILNQVLMEDMHAGRRFVLVIDEAQNLGDSVLEAVRTLSNFETPWMKLIQIVLSGQPQLAEKLSRPSMSQLRQRVSFSIRLESLNHEEVNAYIDHRLWIAGYNGPSLFSVGARMLLAEGSEGIPRNISNLCFGAMSLCWATNAKVVDRDMIRDVMTDLNLDSPVDKAPVLPTLASESTQIVPPAASRPFLTVKEVPSGGWLNKVAIAAVVLLVLAWSGNYFNIGQRLAPSLQSIESFFKSSAAPKPAPAPLGAVTLPSLNPSVPNPAPLAPTADQTDDGPQQGTTSGTVDPLRSRQDTN